MLPRGPVFAVEGARLGMLIFLCAEGMLFAGFIAAHLVLRLGAPVWPPPGQPRLPVVITAINSLILIASGVAMRRAALPRPSAGNRSRTSRRLGAAAILGAVFLAVQGWEWARLIAFGLRATTTTYGGLFYTLVGAHAIHAVVGVVWIAAVAAAARPGRPARSGMIAALEMYWLFVVGVWPAIFLLVYLP